ncbi:MAG: hypothetical protein HYU66_12795 [Armatimonadetes bacterium]|nr:hypothetical protein [Armatimonadota bacterium]
MQENRRPASASEPLPWNEAQWERFFTSHARASSPRAAGGAEDAELVGLLGLESLTSPEPPDEPAPDGPLALLPAFRLAHELSNGVEQRLAAGSAPQSLWRRLASESRAVAECIAAGHGLGYAEAHLCGNIVQCRDALRHAEHCAALLRHLRRRRPAERSSPLLGTALFLRFALEERIAGLRDRVWWDHAAD